MTTSSITPRDWHREEFGRTPPGIAGVLEGYLCHALLVQECWLGDELVEPANVVFVQTEPDRWIRFYVDAGDLGWSIDVAWRVINPQPVDSGNVLRYPIRDVGSQFGVVGQRIEHVRFEALQPAPDGQLVLSFSGGRHIALINEADASRFEPLASPGVSPP